MSSICQIALHVIVIHSSGGELRLFHPTKRVCFATWRGDGSREVLLQSSFCFSLTSLFLFRLTCMRWRHIALLRAGSLLQQATVWFVCTRLLELNASLLNVKFMNVFNTWLIYLVQVTLWDIGRPSPPSYKGIPRKLLRVAAEMTPDLYRFQNCAVLS